MPSRQERREIFSARASVRANVRRTIGAGARKVLRHRDVSGLKFLCELVVEKDLVVVLVRGVRLENVGEVSIIDILGSLHLTLGLVKKTLLVKFRRVGIRGTRTVDSPIARARDTKIMTFTILMTTVVQTSFT